MCFYRVFEYDKADNLFALARDVLTNINESQLKCIGSLARAWYCIGLAKRERHEYRAARAAFRKSVELAGAGIEQRRGHKSIVSFEYNMARCYGLGIGFIAYNESLPNDAMSALTVARHLMAGKQARFIDAYIRIVHASTMMSESAELKPIDDAIKIIETAAAIFSQERPLDPPALPGRITPAKGHEFYWLRAKNELALAYLRRARSEQTTTRTSDLNAARDHVADVKKAALKARDTYSARAYWTAVIAEARIICEGAKRKHGAEKRGDYQAALRLTEQARSEAGKLPSIVIDACIGIGEAAVGCGQYQEAIAAFNEALDLGRASPKIGAVCRLHLCRAYLDNDKPEEAREQFRLFREASPGLENAFIAGFATEMRDRLSRKFENFELRREHVAGHLHHSTYLNWLRRWLADTAYALGGDDPERGRARLKLSRKRFEAWRKLAPKDLAD
jgi:tetratricopeptide (TPR) repeat protein